MSSVSRCRACGVFIETQDRFCWSCGTDLVAPPPSRPRPPAPPELDPELGLALRRARLAQQRGSLEEAERLVREALMAEPGNVPALSMLAEILRARGDEVGAVEAAYHATEQAAVGGAPPGALRKAREHRAEIEQEVVRSLTEESPGRMHRRSGPTRAAGPAWRGSLALRAVLVALGLAGLVLALTSAFGGGWVGLCWLVLAPIMGGWCYHDSETHGEPGIFWGVLVLFLGPFGLAIYLLHRQ